jgi:hypothetical protein
VCLVLGTKLEAREGIEPYPSWFKTNRTHQRPGNKL